MGGLVLLGREGDTTSEKGGRMGLQLAAFKGNLRYARDDETAGQGRGDTRKKEGEKGRQEAGRYQPIRGVASFRMSKGGTLNQTLQKRKEKEKGSTKGYRFRATLTVPLPRRLPLVNKETTRGKGLFGEATRVIQKNLKLT